MLPYLHILVKVENDGSLRALGAFTSREKQQAYQKARGLSDKDVRLDFYNGPFNPDIKEVYAGHRRWNMDRYQLGGYFQTEGEAWNFVTHEGYVSLFRIDTTYEEEQKLEEDALKLYNKLQKRWRLNTYDELVKREGIAKTRANITLRFYKDALESFKPKTRRDYRAFYSLIVLLPILPLSIIYMRSQAPKFGEDLPSVRWLPSEASNVSFYRSNKINVYEFNATHRLFKELMEDKGMKVEILAREQLLSRYKAYLPAEESDLEDSVSEDDDFSEEELIEWQNSISVNVSRGLIATGEGDAIAVFDAKSKRAYYEELLRLK